MVVVQKEQLIYARDCMILSNTYMQSEGYGQSHDVAPVVHKLLGRHPKIWNNFNDIKFLRWVIRYYQHAPIEEGLKATIMGEIETKS